MRICLIVAVPIGCGIAIFEFALGLEKLGCFAPGSGIGVQCWPGSESDSGIRVSVAAGFRWEVGLSVGVRSLDWNLGFDIF